MTVAAELIDIDSLRGNISSRVDAVANPAVLAEKTYTVVIEQS